MDMCEDQHKEQATNQNNDPHEQAYDRLAEANVDEQEPYQEDRIKPDAIAYDSTDLPIPTNPEQSIAMCDMHDGSSYEATKEHRPTKSQSDTDQEFVYGMC
jgi:hypothetical protein